MTQRLALAGLLALAACATTPTSSLVPDGPAPSAVPAEDLDDPTQPVGGLQAVLARVEYPPEARRRGISGVVLVSAVVDTTGEVVWLGIEEPVHPMLDEAAARAVRESRFEPGTLDGEVVPVRIPIPITFTLR